MYVDSNTINNKFTEPTVYFWRGSRIIFDHTPHQIAIQRRSLYGTVNCKQRVIPLHLHTLTIFLFYLFFLSTFVCCLSKQKKQNCMNERISRVSLCGLASDLFQNGSRGWLPILLSIVFLMEKEQSVGGGWGGVGRVNGWARMSSLPTGRSIVSRLWWKKMSIAVMASELWQKAGFLTQKAGWKCVIHFNVEKGTSDR